MDQVQVKRLDAESSRAGVKRAQRTVIALIGVPQFGGDEQLVARYAGVCDRLSNAFFVAVSTASWVSSM
jgi:hypothetical protein